MNLTTRLLHRIAEPGLTPDERAQLRCQLAQHLEEVGNYEAAREALGDLWQGIGERPALDDLDQSTAAEALLRVGVLSGWLGCVEQVEGAQKTAKDLIHESIRRFEALSNDEKMAEAQMELGYCYWREGAFDEARVMLREALGRLTDKAGDLKAVTLLRSAAVEKVSNRLNDALHILMEAAPLFEASSNHTIKGRFHNEYGTVLKNLGRDERRSDYTDRALIEYAAASYHFEQAGHTRYQAYVENNLGYLYGTIQKFAEAHEHLDRAQALFTSLKDKAHIAQVDDTRARVLLKEGRILEAEKFARSAVQVLEEDDQQALFAEALTTHGTALARLGQYQRARLVLQSAIEVAQKAGDIEDAGLAALAIIEDLGEQLTCDDLNATYQRALDLLSASRNLATLTRLSTCAQRVLFLIGGLPGPLTWKGFILKKAVRRYEGRVIERALKEAGGIVTRASRLLGYKNHNSLIKKLNTHHPDLLKARTQAKPRKQSLMFISDSDRETQPLSILHVEDNRMVADAVKEALELEGWRVETCRDAATALQSLEGPAHYDVLIFDHKLPDMEGVELIRRTRQLPGRKHTPVIILSASDVEQEAHGAGANAFLRKPNDMTIIAETIARLLARKPKDKGKQNAQKTK
jgi:CheY-like chemotaxis protein